jgi:hypothetical protein
MPNLFSVSLVGHRHAWRLFLALLVAAGLNACSSSRAPEAARVGAEPPPLSASPPPPPVPVVRPSPALPPGAAFGGGIRGEAAAKPPTEKIGGEAHALPQFDWPPPKASAEQSIPDKWLRTGPATRLSDVADKLEKALRLAHYEQRSYYGVPHGFALATQLEQIKPDGTPLPGTDRWKIGTPQVSNLSLLTFIEALAHAPVGYYRVIVFVVTDASWAQSATPPPEDQVIHWASSGAHALPTATGFLPYGPGYRTQALVYEFRKGKSGPAKPLHPSPVSGETHLDKGGIWEPLSIL